MSGTPKPPFMTSFRIILISLWLAMAGMLTGCKAPQQAEIDILHIEGISWACNVNTSFAIFGSSTESEEQAEVFLHAREDEIDTGRQHVGAVRLARPKYRENSPPKYPKRARKRGYEGTVVLRVLVNRQGRVDDLLIDVSSNHTMLDRAAANSVRKWFFEPGRRGKNKIDMWVKVPVTFKLDE